MEVEVLDVGQGTSVVVRTRGHTLVYDAGPAFQTGADAGSGVVLPALHGRGLDEIDALVLSHSDLDHIGGTESVLAGVDVKSVLAGEAVPGIAAEQCVAGMAWQWDGVRFSVVWPPSGLAFEGNDASCVLLIETRAQRVLLAGDIGEGGGTGAGSSPGGPSPGSPSRQCDVIVSGAGRHDATGLRRGWRRLGQSFRPPPSRGRRALPVRWCAHRIHRGVRRGALAQH